MRGIARALLGTEGTVEKHVHGILAKLRLPAGEDDHRRVLAVITFLAASRACRGSPTPAAALTARAGSGAG